MYTKIPVAELQIGMFVADIDRPWMDTPFLIQGFLIENQGHISQLQQYCKVVTIDRVRSLGKHQQTPKLAQKSAEAGRETIVGQRPPDRKMASQTVAAAPAAGNGATSAKPPRETIPGSSQTQSMQELVITSRDAEFRPTESGRFVLTPKPHADAGHASKLTPPPNLKKSLWHVLTGLIRGEDGNNTTVKLTTDVAPPPGENGTPRRHAFIPPGIRLVNYEDTVPSEAEHPAATSAFNRTTDLLHRIAQDIRCGQTLALQEVEEVIADMVDSMVRNPDALMWVMRLREKDTSTYRHGLCIAVSLLALGRHLGLPKPQLNQLGAIGLLLDIGKIKLPEELLLKNNRLSTAEFETLKTHVQLGVDLLSASGTLDPDILTGIAQHHERENASGYPRSLAGPNISLFGRMAAIADCFVALTNQRPYAGAVSAYDALRSLSGWGGEYFHAPLVEQFIQAIGVFPVGSLVELSTGEVAAVISHNKARRLKPKVLVITGPDKTRSLHPATMDLLYAPIDQHGQSVFIRRGLASGAYGLDSRDFYIS